MIVIKFGGTSVGDAEAIRRAAAITGSRRECEPVVVVSALAGTTNALLAIVEQAARGHLIGALRGVEAIRERHLAACDELLDDDGAQEIASDVGAACDELASLAEALSVLGHATPRSVDAVAGFGEAMSSLLVAAAFRAAGIDAEHVDARRIMITDDRHTQARPDLERIGERSREILLPLLRAGRVPVIAGYIGATGAGVTTTLGRGGSDYSASLIGAALGASDIEIWTDVDGMLTADPRIVPAARPIPEIRFDEAAELASFGAKVLHPSTIAPAVRAGIPVYILNSRRPDGAGTRITFDAPRRPVSAIAARTGVTLLRVAAPRMLLAHGFLRSVFDVFDRHGTSVDVVATSEISVSVTLDDAAHLDDLLIDLRMLGDVAIERGRALVAVVGSAIGDHTTAMARALAALGTVRIHMLSLSATRINLTTVVDERDAHDAMRALHHEFFEETE